MVALDKKCTVTCPKSGKRVDTLLVCQCGENNEPCLYFEDDDGLCLYCSFPNMVVEAEGFGRSKPYDPTYGGSLKQEKGG